jgi:hypothetical protein
VPTFLEILWSNLYAAECSRLFAAYANTLPPKSSSDLPAATLQSIADKAAAFADEMVTRTPEASLAALQAAIAALKP